MIHIERKRNKGCQADIRDVPFFLAVDMGKCLADAFCFLYFQFKTMKNHVILRR